MPKLEIAINYSKNDKNSIGIWNQINKEDFNDERLFSLDLINFLELDKLMESNQE